MSNFPSKCKDTRTLLVSQMWLEGWPREKRKDKKKITLHYIEAKERTSCKSYTTHQFYIFIIFKNCESCKLVTLLHKLSSITT